MVVALAAGAPQAHAEQVYSQTVFFGDSLTDSGHFRPTLIEIAGPSAAIVGKFTTNPGLVWSEYLANYYGTDATSDNQGGTNYAVGGARVDEDNVTALGVAPSIASQVTSYLASTGGVADANALYTVWGGANDLFAVAGGAPAQATIATAVTTEIGLVGTLQAAGAQYILVATIPDLGRTPEFLAGGAASSAAGTQLATSYNTALFSGLAASGLRVIPLDTYTLIDEITADPTTYGFTNATETACTVASSVTCSPLDYVTPTAATDYIFADGVHPSAAAHEVLAQYALSVLEGPRQISVLTHSATVTGYSRAERVAMHADATEEGQGLRWWGNVRGDMQRQQDGDLYDGTTPAGLFGIDWLSGGWTFGGFAGYGKGTQDFGHSSGKFDQEDTTLGGFAQWAGHGGWVNAQVSYNWLKYDVTREIQLGAATRKQTGSPDGSNLTVAINGGFDFSNGGAWKTGPVLGLVSQTIKVDGYDEKEFNSTALSYRDQEFDSLIGSVGWRASYEISPTVTPYVQATYNHEFEDNASMAWASLQTIPSALPYAVPGVEFDQDYGVFVVGARAQLGGLSADIGARTTIGQSAANDAGIFISLGGSF
ncbi:autotransporter domain-containing protein [Pseudoxanthomonas sp.]|uniref:autotransporter domain-containing protein n=1 Tax=Pseudoxanthomonas sp. TaxID=1871049 RepID=UPI002610F693|nr:autotransporter domain-containing protein [Pseudoxanthomonas sp.]WDS38193.1 MAG: autotransporter domain-containing protein [Pseudoxanthomonas sp.]